MFHPVKAPQHYAGDGEIDCKRAMKSMMHKAESILTADAIYWWGCALKYLWRWPWKDGIRDIEKCIQCMQYMKDEIEQHGIENDQLINNARKIWENTDLSDLEEYEGYYTNFAYYNRLGITKEDWKKRKDGKNDCKSKA